jgi:pyrroline-5-carboxylate reductase
MVELQVIGGGRMGEALVGGLLSAGGRRLDQIRVVEADPARLAALTELFPGVEVLAEPGPATGTVIATKPGDVDAACRAVADAGTERVLSVAAGIDLAALEAALAPGTPVVRAMPNVAALVAAGASAIAGGSAASEADLAWAEDLLGSVGAVVRVAEGQLDAVTGLSGSGPAYVFLVAEALVDAGVHEGLSREVSTTLAVQTLLGAARMLDETGSGAEALRAQVTSPGGTTAAGLRVLEQRAVRAAVGEAVTAAADRSRALGAPQQPAPR